MKRVFIRTVSRETVTAVMGDDEWHDLLNALSVNGTDTFVVIENGGVKQYLKQRYIAQIDVTEADE